MVAFMAVYFANDLWLSKFMVAMAITTLGLGSVIGPIGFEWLSDRLSLGLSALATVWVAFQGASLPLLLLSRVFHGTVTRSRMTLTQAVVADSLPDEDRDAAFSAFFFLGFASRPVWLLLAGSLIQTLGFSVAFPVLAVSYLMGMLLMLFATDPRNASTGGPKPATTSAE